MALVTNVEFETLFGTTVESLYWRWVDLKVNLLSKEITVVLNGYVDEDAFNNGKQSVAQRATVLTGDDFWTAALSIDGPSPKPISETIYEFAKQKDEYFAEAVDK